MKIIVVGGRGRIGSKIVESLSGSHEVISVGARSGDIRVDYTDADSIQKMYQAIGPFQALVVVVGGDSIFRPCGELTDDDFRIGFERKFLGQLNLVRIGQDHATDGGCFTLSSGFLSDYPNEYSVATGPFNAAVDCYVRSVAPLLQRGLRLNVVSPAPVVEPDQQRRGTITAEQAAAAYVDSIEGDFTGCVLRAWGGLEDDDNLQTHG